MADFFLKIMCCYCQQEIQDLRIKCVDCKDFYICPECFKCGAEIGSHRNYHRYQFENPDTAPLCGGSDGWTAREEFLLLDAIEQYGYGNWEDISDHVETRNAEDALNEYVTRCIEGSIGRLTWSTAANNKPDLNKQIKPDVGPLSPGITSKLPQLNVSPEDAKILGYMPQRDDFEREHDNSAEDLVSPLFISSLEDDELDIGNISGNMSETNNSSVEAAPSMLVEADHSILTKGEENRPVKGTENSQAKTVNTIYMLENCPNFKLTKLNPHIKFVPKPESSEESERRAERKMLQALKDITGTFPIGANKDIPLEVAEQMLIAINNIFVEAFQNVYTRNEDISIIAAHCATEPVLIEAAKNSLENAANNLSEGENQNMQEQTIRDLPFEANHGVEKETSCSFSKASEDTAVETAENIRSVVSENVKENTSKDILMEGSQNLPVGIATNVLIKETPCVPLHAMETKPIETINDILIKAVQDVLPETAQDILRKPLALNMLEDKNEHVQNLQVEPCDVSVSPATSVAVHSLQSKVENSETVSDILTDPGAMSTPVSIPPSGETWHFKEETEETAHLSNRELEYLVMLRRKKLMKTRQMYYELKMGIRN